MRRQDLEPFAFAGLWEFARIGGEDIVSTAIIVCDANERVAPLHERMPVILEPADYDAWLDPATPTREAHALLQPCPAEMLEAYPVSVRALSAAVGISFSTLARIERGEALQRPDFQRQLRRDPAALVEAGKAALTARYGR